MSIKIEEKDVNMLSYKSRANDDLRRQVSGTIDPAGINMHSLWRACGSPGGEDPHAWHVLAAPVMDALNFYYGSPVWACAPNWQEQLHPHFYDGAEFHEGSGDRNIVEWEPGDVAASKSTAEMYVDFLDRELIEAIIGSGDEELDDYPGPEGERS